MSIPAILRPGLVSIYGQGSTAGTNGFIAPTPNFLFGLVDQTWGSMADKVSVGQSVLYDINDAVVTMVYSNSRYVIIPEEKIILIETTPP